MIQEAQKGQAQNVDQYSGTIIQTQIYYAYRNRHNRRKIQRTALLGIVTILLGDVW